MSDNKEPALLRQVIPSSIRPPNAFTDHGTKAMKNVRHQECNVALVRDFIIAATLAVYVLGVSPAGAEPLTTDRSNEVAMTSDGVSSFLQLYCTRCHGKDKQEGKVAFHKLELTSIAERTIHVN